MNTQDTDQIEREVEEFAKEFGNYSFAEWSSDLELARDWLRASITRIQQETERRERKHVLHSLGLWWINDNMGVSSKAIFMYMTQNIVPKAFDAPHDASDRKRCVMLLRAVPEWVDRLSEIEEYKIECTSNGKKVMPWNEQIPLIREAITTPNHD